MSDVRTSDVDRFQDLCCIFAWMEVLFEDERLGKVEAKSAVTGKGKGVDKKFRDRMKLIRSAPDERDFYALKSLHFERLRGRRSDQHSMKINDQWRLIVRLTGKNPEKVVVIVGIEDYH